MKSFALSGAVSSLDKSALSLSRARIIPELNVSMVKAYTAIPGANIVGVKKGLSFPMGWNISSKPTGNPITRPMDKGSNHTSLKFLLANIMNLILSAPSR
jgi:hypothetical protein